VKYQPINFFTPLFTHFREDIAKIINLKSCRSLSHTSLILHEFNVMENQLILMSGNIMLAT